jgi:hypothetical protein
VGQKLWEDEAMTEKKKTPGHSNKKECKAGGKTEKTVYKSLGLRGGHLGAVPCAVDVKNGKINRIRPLHYDGRIRFQGFQCLGDSPERQDSQADDEGPAFPVSLAYKKRSLLSQPDTLSDEAGGLGPQWRAQHPEPGQEQVCPDFLG